MRFFDFTLDLQPPFLRVDLRNREMTTHIEALVRREEAIDGAEWHLEIDRLLLDHDQTAEPGRICLSALGKDLGRR